MDERIRDAEMIPQTWVCLVGLIALVRRVVTWVGRRSACAPIQVQRPIWPSPALQRSTTDGGTLPLAPTLFSLASTPSPPSHPVVNPLHTMRWPSTPTSSTTIEKKATGTVLAVGCAGTTTGVRTALAEAPTPPNGIPVAASVCWVRVRPAYLQRGPPQWYSSQIPTLAADGWVTSSDTSRAMPWHCVEMVQRSVSRARHGGRKARGWVDATKRTQNQTGDCSRW